MIFETLFLLSLVLQASLGFPDGAPCSTVESMTPNHRGGRFERRPPYRIRIGAACYRPGISIPVSLKGKQSSERFKGFLLQARTVDKTPVERVGEFLDTNSKDWRYQCEGHKESITHTWKDDKYSISTEWHAPTEQGDIRFIATVVKSYSTYWVQQIRSRKLRPCSDVQRELAEKSKEEKPTPASVPVIEHVEQVQKKAAVPKTLCELPAERGHCEVHQGYHQRWYHHKGECYTFWYTGCNGNKNNFDSKETCLARCAKASEEEEEKSDDPSVVCKLSTDQGNWCKPPGWQRKYTFSGAGCVPFDFAGCGGNANRFDTLEECRHTCMAGEGSTSCLRYRDKDRSCKTWLKDFFEACNEIGGSGVIRNLCRRSCCEHLKNRQ